MAEAALLLAWLAPLALAAALLPVRSRRAAIRACPLAALPALVAALLVPSGTTLELSWVLLRAELGLDDIARTFLLLAAVLWGASAWFARDFLARDRRRVSFFAFFLLSMTGSIGLMVALDRGTFLAFYALMSLAAYGLVIHNRDPAALRAGRYYISLAITSEMLVFTALVASGREWSIPLLLVGLGIKAGALGVHVWLPLAHPCAPVPASAVLSGVMIKAGLVGGLRFVPLGDEPLYGGGATVAVLGLAAAFVGVLLGLPQRAPKVILAYSSISQMGLMTALLGFALLEPLLLAPAAAAIALYAVHHGLAKGALFLGVGVFQRAGKRWVLGLMTWLGLALAGAPLTGGLLAKKSLEPVADRLPAPWPAWLSVLLPLSAFATTLLMARLLTRLADEAPDAGETWPSGSAAWLGLCVASTALPWFLVERPDPGITAGALAPVLTGALVAWLAFRRSPSWLIALSGRIPPGDLIAVWEAVRFRGAAHRGGTRW